PKWKRKVYFPAYGLSEQNNKRQEEEGHLHGGIGGRLHTPESQDGACDDKQKTPLNNFLHLFSISSMLIGVLAKKASPKGRTDDSNVEPQGPVPQVVEVAFHPFGNRCIATPA